MRLALPAPAPVVPAHVVAAATARLVAAATAHIVAAATAHVVAAARGLATLEVGAAIILVGEIGVPMRPVASAAIGAFARLVALGAELRLRRHDDAAIMLGVLEIALGRDQIARRQRVARERHVLFGDMCRGPADLHVGPIGFVAPCQWILGLASAAAAPAVLLSLPHRLVHVPDKRRLPQPSLFKSSSLLCSNRGAALFA